MSKQSDSHKLFIIVPIYNVESYLKSCLDSIQRQIYSNFVAVMVDDGSRDDSARIAFDYAKNDNRFILLSQENGGVAKARNYALDYIFTTLKPHKNDYIGFVDSDDIIAWDYFDRLIACMNTHQTPIAKSRNIVRFDNTNAHKIALGGGQNKFRFLHKTFVTQTNNDNINSRIEVYRILYRCHFVESLRFCEVRLCEDLSFNTLCNALAKNIAYTRQARYFYRQREGSLMKKYKYLYDDCLKNFAWLLERFIAYNLLDSYKIPLDLVKNIPQDSADLHFDNLRKLIASYNLNDEILRKNPQLKAILDSANYAEFSLCFKNKPKERFRQLFRFNIRKSGIHIRIFGKNIIDKYF